MCRSRELSRGRTVILRVRACVCVRVRVCVYLCVCGLLRVAGAAHAMTDESDERRRVG